MTKSQLWVFATRSRRCESVAEIRAPASPAPLVSQPFQTSLHIRLKSQVSVCYFVQVK